MKVAIVSFYLMESTIPLAKHISQGGVDVDLYSLLPKGDQNTFVFDFLSNRQPVGFVNSEIARKVMGKKLCDYLSTINTKIFIYPSGRIQNLLFQDFYYAYKFGKYIKKRNYDLIHIIHASKRFWSFLYFFIGKKKIVQTLHEVTSHESKTPKDRISVMKSLIKKSIPIIFNSNISKERFIDFRKTVTEDDSEDNLEMIRFSLFETYHCFSNDVIKTNESGKIKILNFGRIIPYKGIHFLVKAVELLQHQYPIHLIVAGAGTPDFDFSNVSSYEFINRFFSNEEVVSLIEECDMVVLPYISSSQSGVPMTVFAFNKPVIASNIAGFKEVIDHMKTGILVDNLNEQTLASSIEILLKNPQLKEIMKRNIQKKYSEGEFSWKSIAEKTIMFYKKQIGENKWN